MAKKNIKIFFASSNDVEEEREQSVKTLARLEKVHDHLHLEAVRWEDDVDSGNHPGYSTLQGPIDAVLKKCKIVVFIFNKKAGKNTLGELATAKKYRKKIFAFFKIIDKKEIEEGEPVEAVKRTIESSILIKTYKDVTDYDRVLYEELNKYLKRRYPVPQKWPYIIAAIIVLYLLFKWFTIPPTPCNSKLPGTYIAIADFNKNKSNNDLPGLIMANLEGNKKDLHYNTGLLGKSIDSIDFKWLNTWLNCRDTGVVIYGTLHDVNNKSFHCNIQFHNYKSLCNIQIDKNKSIAVIFPAFVKFDVPATASLIGNFVKATLFSITCNPGISNTILQQLQTDTNFIGAGRSFKAYCHLLQGNNFVQEKQFQAADSVYKLGAALDPTISELITNAALLHSNSLGISDIVDTPANLPPQAANSDTGKTPEKNKDSPPMNPDSQIVNYIVLNAVTQGVTYKNKESFLNTSIQIGEKIVVRNQVCFIGKELQPGTTLTDTIFLQEGITFGKFRDSEISFNFVPDSTDKDWNVLLNISLFCSNPLGTHPTMHVAKEVGHLFTIKDHFKSSPLLFTD